MGGHAGVKGDMLANSGKANNLSTLYGSNALGIGSSLTPQLEAEAANPQGYSPATMGAMTTAAEQGAGGATAGAAGQAGLRAARTRNIGGSTAAADSAARTGSQQLSQTQSEIQGANANLKAKQQQAGLSGLQGMYGTNVGAGENALGLSNSALNGASQLDQNNFWQQAGLAGIKSAGAAAAGAGY